MPVTLTRSGKVMRLVHDSGVAASGTANTALLRLIIKARRWWRLLREGAIDVRTLAEQEGVQPSYVTRVVRLAFLSPQITDATLRGGLRADIDISALTLGGPPAACWRQQAALYLPTPV